MSSRWDPHLKYALEFIFEPHASKHVKLGMREGTAAFSVTWDFCLLIFRFLGFIHLEINEAANPTSGTNPNSSGKLSPVTAGHLLSSSQTYIPPSPYYSNCYPCPLSHLNCHHWNWDSTAPPTKKNETKKEETNYNHVPLSKISCVYS